MATQNFETLRACVQALDVLPELLKPFAVEGTKLRLPKEIGDPLCGVVSQLRPILDGVHYEGVEYEYQNEDPGEGLRLQAERVVAAYKELRADTNSANFKSDNFPVGLFAELVTEIKRLGEQAADRAAREADDAETDADEQQAIGAAWDRQRAAGMHRDIAETDTERALRAIETARRIADVCAGSVKAIDCENSHEIALTMGNELFAALDEARQALKPDETETEDEQGGAS